MKKSILLLVVLFSCSSVLFAQSAKKNKLVPVTTQNNQAPIDESSKKELKKNGVKSKSKKFLINGEDLIESEKKSKN